MRRVGSSKVDVEADSILLEVKTNYPTGTHEILCLSHGENRQFSKSSQRKTFPLTLANEEYVASMGGLGHMNVSNTNGPRPDLFSLDCAFQFVVKRIVFESAQNQRVAVAVKSIVRPLHKLREMK